MNWSLLALPLVLLVFVAGLLLTLWLAERSGRPFESRVARWLVEGLVYCIGLSASVWGAASLAAWAVS